MDVREKYEKLTKFLISKKISITTMESCTSGQIASLITDTEGASAIMKGAFITYSNEAKIKAGVSAETIEKYGVYSAETSLEMAKECLEYFNANIGIGVTGSFGNADPNNPDSVPGEVYFSIVTQNNTIKCTDGTKDSSSEDKRNIIITKLLKIPYKENRLSYKLFVAESIADELLDLLAP